MCFVVFNVLQYLGSVACSYLKNLDGTTRKAQIVSCTVSILRLVFVPLIMMCNVAPENRNTEVMHMFRKIAYSIRYD